MNKRSKKRISFKNADKRMFIRAGVIVIAIIAVLSIAAFKLGGYSRLGISKGISSITDGVTGKGSFPQKVSSNDIVRMTMCYNDLALLDDTALKVIDRSGKTVSDFQHNYSSALVYTYGNNMLVLDADGNKFRVQTSGKIIYEKEFDFELLTGDISRNGSVAIASKSDQGASMLSVFDTKQREVFSWICAKQQIVCVDISENGKLIAVGVIGADSGDILSDVYLFDIDYNDAITHIELPGTSIVKVDILSGNRLAVIGDNVVTFVDKNGERNDIDVSLDTLSRYFVSDNNITAVLLSKYSSAYSNILKVYSSSGKEISSTEIEGQVKDLNSDGKHIALLCDGKLICYDIHGRLTGEKNIDNDALCCCVNGSDAYVLFSNSINRFSVKGNADERQTQPTVETVDEEVIN